MSLTETTKLDYIPPRSRIKETWAIPPRMQKQFPNCALVTSRPSDGEPNENRPVGSVYPAPDLSMITTSKPFFAGRVARASRRVWIVARRGEFILANGGGKKTSTGKVCRLPRIERRSRAELANFSSSRTYFPSGDGKKGIPSFRRVPAVLYPAASSSFCNYKHSIIFEKFDMIRAGAWLTGKF